MIPSNCSLVSFKGVTRTVVTVLVVRTRPVVGVELVLLSWARAELRVIRPIAAMRISFFMVIYLLRVGVRRKISKTTKRY
jgi:hypothetical protein